MDQAVKCKQWSGPPPIKVAPNEVHMVTGERISFKASEVLITRGDIELNIKLELRLNHNFFDEDRGYLQEVIWPCRPRWSNGTALAAEEIAELAGKVEAASATLNCWIWQLNYPW